MKYWLWFFGVLFSTSLFAAVTLPVVIGNNMVLQRNQSVPIWGFADPGEKVTISFHNQTKTTTANASGKWQVMLDAMKADSKPASMIIKGTNNIELKNILVGEVWFCSGQSNMEYTMRKNSKVEKKPGEVNSPVDELERAKNPAIRIFLVTNKNQRKPNPEHNNWSIARDSALRSFSAPAYFFAKEINDKLHVPVGVIAAAIPGSAIEPFLPGTIQSDLQTEAGRKNIQIDEKDPGKFYPNMIEPVAPFAIKGFLWYQGETNCFQNETIEYTAKMKMLIDGWRRLWGNEALPFYYVQISPFYYSKSAGKYPLDKETLPKFWEAQAEALKIPNTGMIVITDLAISPDDLHPRGKWEVGRRLAQWALAKDYNMNVVPSGPMYTSKEIKGNKIILHFNYTGKGLVSNDGKPLNYFTIAGADGKFYPANAVISGEQVVVSSPDIAKPTSVRFAWDEAAQPNFFNKNGLPAVPFRTDNPYQ